MCVFYSLHFPDKIGLKKKKKIENYSIFKIKISYHNLSKNIWDLK